MSAELCPVECPNCGESQNTMSGNFDPAQEPFGPVHCMVCGHEFSATEYRAGQEARRQKLDKLMGPITPKM